MQCETTDFIYPLLVDVYYPVVEQGAYGNVKKQWILDRSIACNFASFGRAGKEEVVPNVNITKDNILLGRVRSDIRVSLNNSRNAVTNVLLTNIRTAQQDAVYVETSGARNGRSTIFEIATLEPVIGPFGSVEYHKVVIKRSENQASDL
jgi:hypothetical protein